MKLMYKKKIEQEKDARDEIEMQHGVISVPFQQQSSW